MNGLIKSEKNKRKSFYVNFNLVKKSIRKNSCNTANVAYLEGINPGKLSRSLEIKINSFLKNENCAATNFENNQNSNAEYHSNLLPYPLEHMWKEIFSYFSNVC